MAVCQPTLMNLTRRHREQAHSYNRGASHMLCDRQTSLWELERFSEGDVAGISKAELRLVPIQ